MKNQGKNGVNPFMSDGGKISILELNLARVKTFTDLKGL